MGPKIGFGANKKKIFTRNDAPNPLATFWGIFIFIMMGRKMASRKCSVFPPDVGALYIKRQKRAIRYDVNGKIYH